MSVTGNFQDLLVLTSSLDLPKLVSLGIKSPMLRPLMNQILL